MKLMYVRYASRPFGEIATAGKSGRSVDGEPSPPESQLLPPVREYSRCTRSFGWLVLVGVGPSVQASTISSVAPVPNGAPLAMSTVGKEPSRAPATPSLVKPPTGSKMPDETKCVTIRAGRSKWMPPSNERIM
jgi:hypothetical protein